MVAAAGGGGSVVFVTSVHEHIPLRGNAPYSAAKHGLGGLVKVASLELAEHGIRVNAVAPGQIATRMTGQEGPPEPDRSDGIPLGRAGYAGGDRVDDRVPGGGWRVVHHRGVGGRGRRAAVGGGGAPVAPGVPLGRRLWCGAWPELPTEGGGEGVAAPPGARMSAAVPLPRSVVTKPRISRVSDHNQAVEPPTAHRGPTVGGGAPAARARMSAAVPPGRSSAT